MGTLVCLDTVLVPLSVFLTVGYHAYLWHIIKQKPSQTTIGIDMLRRKAWFVAIKEGDDKKGMLAVQSLRNSLMATILTASLSILVNLSLAALTNNAYNGSHLFKSSLFGLQSGRLFVVKLLLASVFLLASFWCSSMAIGTLIDANFLLNACGEFRIQSHAYTQTILERGFVLALVGNRVLCISFPLLIWLFGPVAVALSSVALLWGLYEFDFADKLAKRDVHTSMKNSQAHKSHYRA